MCYNTVVDLIKFMYVNYPNFRIRKEEIHKKQAERRREGRKKATKKRRVKMARIKQREKIKKQKEIQTEKNKNQTENEKQYSEQKQADLYFDRRWRIVRREVIKRDGGRCRLCGKRGIDVHHIIPIDIDPLLRFDKNNLILLCLDCHRKQHPKLPLEFFLNRWGV